jgi:hypothetical protein
MKRHLYIRPCMLPVVSCYLCTQLGHLVFTNKPNI